MRPSAGSRGRLIAKKPGLVTNSIFSSQHLGKKSLICPMSEHLTTLFGAMLLYSLSAAPLSGPWILERHFEVTWRPSKALYLALCIASRTTEIKAHFQVFQARCGSLRTPSKTAYANHDCVPAENTLSSQICEL